MLLNAPGKKYLPKPDRGKRDPFCGKRNGLTLEKTVLLTLFNRVVALRKVKNRGAQGGGGGEQLKRMLTIEKAYLLACFRRKRTE